MKGGKIMLGEKALSYYRQGYSCSACILRAGGKLYKLKIPPEIYDMCQGVNNGFGIGEMCSVIVAAVLLLGLIYKDEKLIKQKRLLFLSGMQEKFGSLNCGKLKKNCSETIREAGNLLEKIIE
jgi:hypothetical protein